MSCCNSNCNHDPCGSSFNQALTKAAQYAQYAQTQANKAENLWLEFNALYLGAFAVAPTTDNEGNPLQEGALYFNSTSNQMFVWQGGSWIDFDFDEFTPFLATGTTTARNLVTRFADVVNVKDFGAVGNGVADDRPAIQQAINFNTGRAIYFPAGIYNIGDTININGPQITLYCDAPGSARINLTNLSSSAAIRIQSSTPGNNIYRPCIQNLTISRNAGSTYAIGVDIEEAQDLRIHEVEIYNFATCIKAKGCFVCMYSNLRLNSNNSTNTDPKKGIIELTQTTLSTPPFEGYTHLFVNCHISGGRYGIRLLGTDHVSFSNCYLSSGAEGGVLIEPDATQTIGNYNNNFDNFYFDRAGSVADKYAITINDLTTPPPANAVGTKITDCVFTGWEKHIYINKAFDPHIELTGCRFSGAGGSAIDCTGNYTNLVVTGNQFYSNTSTISGSSTIDIKDVHSASITGNVFSLIYQAPPAYPGTRDMIRLAGTIDALTITGNAIQNDSGTTITDFSNTATIGKLVLTGNASDNPTNTIVGNVIGNQDNSSSVALDWYEEKTFIPTLSFGGNSTGITYGPQTGSATRIGNRVFFSLYLAISNKGTSTGNAKIEGLPFNQNLGQPANYTINAGGLNAAIGDANLDAIQDGVTGIQPKKQSGGGSASLTDVDFTNSTYITITGTYSA